MLKLRTTFAAFMLLVLAPSSSALAQSSDTKGVNLRALGDRSAAPAKPGKAASGMKACPEYGAGFYRLAGSDTCARISGGVASEIGTTVRR